MPEYLPSRSRMRYFTWHRARCADGTAARASTARCAPRSPRPHASTNAGYGGGLKVQQFDRISLGGVGTTLVDSAVTIAPAQHITTP
jgi:hypothetical protein